ncbi:hypothetical protein QR680_005846 [Steinernema hermaphroditum]|uniref:Uncharacterized protein n=1 Tax=Steinernema hermaphroditum TaxID=289476 RepID=A0AA39HTJ8_9BILA|nr:hypothetical protein QR680_005846 [Steinernema hermaphroditum]
MKALLLLFLLLGAVSPCMRMSPGGGPSGPTTVAPVTPAPETTTTTTEMTTTTTACTGPHNNAGIFVSNSVDQTTMVPFGPIGSNAQPTATCPCNDGMKYFFNLNIDNDWESIIASGSSLAFELNCPGTQACVCTSPSECYMPSATDMTFAFAPFCDPATRVCSIYMKMEANGLDDGMVPAPDSSGTAFDYKSQLDPQGSPLPLPGPYRKINAVGCGGCPLPMNC